MKRQHNALQYYHYNTIQSLLYVTIQKNPTNYIWISLVVTLLPFIHNRIKDIDEYKLITVSNNVRKFYLYNDYTYHMKKTGSNMRWWWLYMLV